MGWFENLRTRSKLVLGFGPLLVMLVIVVAFAYGGITSTQASQHDVVDSHLSPVVKILQARSNLNHVRADILEIMLTTDAAARTALETDLAAKEAAIEERLAAAQSGLRPVGDPADLALLDEVIAMLAAYRETATQELDFVHQGKVADALALSQGVQEQRVNSMRDDLATVVTALEDGSAAAVAASQELVNTTLLILGLVAALAVILVLAMIWLLNRTIAEPLATTARVIRDMSRGELGARLELGRRDEIGIVAAAVDQLADTVQGMIAESGVLVEAGVAGRLSTRGDEQKFEGDFRRIVKGVNDTLDAVIGPLNVAADYVDRIARGDIPRPITDTYNGDFNLLKDNLNRMAENLRDLNQDLQVGFGVLATSSTEILTTISQVAAGAAETATAVSETSTTAEEVRQTAHLSSQKARGVQEGAFKTAAISEAGRKAVDETLEGMNRIREQMEAIGEAVVRLSEQGQAIGEIIATVNDLAEESNMLAVNAAIEATRAGEYGKGFAVVAREVKSLAEQSRQATTQVRAILSEVQKATSAAVMASEQGSKAVAAGVKQATDAGESIRSLAGNATEAAQAATQISASSDQQLAGMEQIASAIDSIRQATNQNMAGTKQLEASAQSLQELGQRLKVLVDRQHVEA